MAQNGEIGKLDGTSCLSGISIIVPTILSPFFHTSIWTKRQTHFKHCKFPRQPSLRTPILCTKQVELALPALGRSNPWSQGRLSRLVPGFSYQPGMFTHKEHPRLVALHCKLDPALDLSGKPCQLRTVPHMTRKRTRQRNTFGIIWE